MPVPRNAVLGPSSPSSSSLSSFAGLRPAEPAGVYLKDGLGDSGDVYERPVATIADAPVAGGAPCASADGTLGEAFGHAGIEPPLAAALHDDLDGLDGLPLLDRLVALPRLERLAVFPRLERLDAQRDLLSALGAGAPVTELLRTLPDDRLVAVAAVLGDAHMARLYPWQDAAGRGRFARLLVGAGQPALSAAVAADAERDPDGAAWSAEAAAQEAHLDGERTQDRGSFAANVTRMALALQQTSADEYVTASEDRRRSFLRKQPPAVAAMYLAMDPGDHASMLRVFVEPAVMAKVLVLHMQATGRRSLASSLTSDELLAVITETSSPTVVGDLVSSLPADAMVPVLAALDRHQLGRVMVRAPDARAAWSACRTLPHETLSHALATLTATEATALARALTPAGRAELVQVAPPALARHLVRTPDEEAAAIR